MLACEDLYELFNSEDFVALVAITLGCLTAMVGILAGSVGGIMKTRAKETTKRELAAYVAEGTLRPEDAISMVNAGKPKREMPDQRVT